MDEMERAYMEYQAEYIKRQNTICTQLLTIAGETTNEIWCHWLLDAVEFIYKEKN